MHRLLAKTAAPAWRAWLNPNTTPETTVDVVVVSALSAVCTGIAGGFGGAGVRPGDVVVADQVVGYQRGWALAEGVLRRPARKIRWEGSS